MFSKDNFLEEDERSFQKFEIYQLKISPFFFSISLSIDSITSFFWQFSLKQSFDFKGILEGIWNIYYHLFVGLCQYFFFICHPLFSMQDFDFSIYILYHNHLYNWSLPFFHKPPHWACHSYRMERIHWILYLFLYTIVAPGCIGGGEAERAAQHARVHAAGQGPGLRPKPPLLPCQG